MRFKKLFSDCLDWLKALFFFSYPFFIIYIAVRFESLAPSPAYWISIVFVYGPYAFLLIVDVVDKIRRKRRRKSNLDKKEAELTKREAAVIKEEVRLTEQAATQEIKASELAEWEANTNELLRSREAEHVRAIAMRDYLASSPVFRSIHTSPDLKRLTSSMTQDMKIRALQITATIHSKSGKEYETTLESCTCTDFDRRKSPCKHMYRLAAEVGLLLTADREKLTQEMLDHMTPPQQKAGRSARRKLPPRQKKTAAP